MRGVIKGLIVGLLAAGVISGVLLAVGSKRKSGDKPSESTASPVPMAALNNNNNNPPTTQAPAPVNPALDPRVPPEGMDVGAVITKSAEALGRFLSLKTLDERKGMIETKTPAEDLAKSVLAGPLPVASTFSSTEVRFNKVEGATDVAFMVGLAGEVGAVENHLMVVRTRGTQDPKVLVDPFLDGYGGRLKALAARPVDDEATFRTVISVYDFCTDKAVPDYESKFTVKMCTHPGGKDIAKAYFAKQSPLAEKLAKMQLAFGRSAGATIVLKWSGGAHPFLEVVDIKALDWNN